LKVIANLKGALKIQSYPRVIAISTRSFHSPAFAMEALVSAILGNLISRSISFAMDRCSSHWWREAIVEDMQRLHRVLLKIHHCRGGRAVSRHEPSNAPSAPADEV
jgi:hypothetical protein